MWRNQKYDIKTNLFRQQTPSSLKSTTVNSLFKKISSPQFFFFTLLIYFYTSTIINVCTKNFLTIFFCVFVDFHKPTVSITAFFILFYLQKYASQSTPYKIFIYEKRRVFVVTGEKTKRKTRQPKMFARQSLRRIKHICLLLVYQKFFVLI